MPVFDLLIEADVHELRKHLPGNIRQQIKRAIDDLAHEPRPPRSRALDVTDLDIAPQIEIRRLRLDPYRIVYALSDQENWVWILAIRRRPPYDYDDLTDLVDRLK